MRWTKLPENMAEFDAMAEKYGDGAEEFKALAGVKTEEDLQALFRTDSFTGMVAGAYLFGTLQARQGRTTYLYEFDPDIPGEDNPGSFHGAELWFAYDSLGRSWRPFSGKHYDLSRKVSSYWVNFVKKGDPNGSDHFGEPLPEWKPFDEAEQFMLLIGNEPAKRDAKIDPLMQLRIDRTLEDMEK